MDQQAREQLPPVPELPAQGAQNRINPETRAGLANERAAAFALEQGISKPQAGPGLGAPLQPLTQPMMPPMGQNPSIPGAAVAAAAPMMADDADLIEKEWVEKAKQIVEQTKDNPYMQNKAMSHLKADYLHKRFNKEVKLGNN